MLAGRRVLVTGASSGIGAATAVALTTAGAVVAVNGRDRRALEAVGTTTKTKSLIAADLTSPGAVDQVIEAAASALGGLDVVVSCAGSGWSGPFPTMAARVVDDLVTINLRVPAQLALAALPYLTESGFGHLVFIGSISGLVGVPGEAVYSATKAGIAGLADALRAELAANGVRVSLIVPGAVATPFFTRRNQPYERRWPRLVTADRVATAVVGCVVTGRAEAVIPRWLALPARLHGGLPNLYRALARRFGP